MGRNPSTRPTTINGLEPSKLLDVACGASHTLFLTRDGLFGCGDNKNYALGPSEPGISALPFFIDVYGEKIVKIWAGTGISVVVTEKNNIYYAGKSILGPLSGTTDGSWDKLELPETLTEKIDILTGAEYGRLIVVAGNKMYELGAQVNQRENFNLTKVSFEEGPVKEVIVTGGYLLIATNTNFYLLIYGSYESGAQTAAEFGGNVERTMPYKLLIEKTEQVEVDEDPGIPSNKKPRFDCQLCGAEARYAYAAATSFFCSKYCLHKSRY